MHLQIHTLQESQIQDSTMKQFFKLVLPLAIFAASPFAAGQAIGTGTLLNGSVSSSFTNPVSEPPGNSSFVYSIDNNLLNGVPSVLTPIPFAAVAGASAFSWGTAAGRNDDTSALWFRPGSFSNVALESPFELGRLYYRNGTITGGTGASQVDLSMMLTFSSPLLQNPTQAISSTLRMINSPNSSDPVASADIVEIGSPASLLTFTDPGNRQYFLELSFQVDQNATDGSLSDFDTFRVFEDQTGQAVLMGRVTVAPIPEPGGALLIAAAGFALLLRRRTRS